MNRPKISIIGAGAVGTACAHWLLTRDLGDIVLLDIEEDLARGKALDLQQSAALTPASVQITGSRDYESIQGSGLVVITAGQARRPGMSRDDLQNINAKIIKKVCENIKKVAPSAFVIVVTNPLDVMAYTAWKSLNFPAQKVIGMAGVLDTARFKTFAAQELNIHPQDIEACVLGGHGDTMALFPRFCRVGGQVLTELLPAEKIKALIDRTKNGGAEVVSLLKTASASCAPALSVVEMIESILKDKKKVLPCSTLLNGEYDTKDLFMGVPCLLGAKGVEKVIEWDLNSEEKKEFQQSVSAVKKQVDKLSF